MFKDQWEDNLKTYFEKNYSFSIYDNKEKINYEEESMDDLDIIDQVKDIDSFFEENFDNEGNRTELNGLEKKTIDDIVTFDQLRRFSTLSNTKISSFFINDSEKPGVNISYVEGSDRLQFLSVDLFLKKIIFDDFMNKNEYLVSAFFTQFTAFLKPEVIINKMISCFTYYVGDVEDSLLNNLIDFSNRIILEFYESRDFIDFKEYKKELKCFYDLLRKHHQFDNSDYSLIEMLLADENSSVYDVEFVRNSLIKRKKAKNVLIKKPIGKVNNTSEEEAPDAFYLLKIDPKEIAEALTQISKLEFALIKQKELVAARFSKESKKRFTSPTIVKITERGNSLIFFVIEEILAYDHKPIRGKMIEQWIKIIEALLALNNFHDSIFVFIALQNYIIQRLKKSWKYVKKDSLNKFEYYSKLFSIGDNYRMLREEIKKHRNEPYLPYLGLIQKDIIHTEEIKKYIKDNNLINFDKIYIIQNLLDDFFDFNNYVYNFNPNSKFAFFHCLVTKTEDELEELEKKIEPDFTLYPKKKDKKRYTKVDETFFPCSELNKERKDSLRNSMKQRKSQIEKKTEKKDEKIIEEVKENEEEKKEEIKEEEKKEEEENINIEINEEKLKEIENKKSKEQINENIKETFDSKDNTKDEDISKNEEKDDKNIPEFKEDS